MTRKIAIRTILSVGEQCRAIASGDFRRVMKQTGRTDAGCKRLARVAVDDVQLCRPHAAETVLAELLEGATVTVAKATP